MDEAADEKKPLSALAWAGVLLGVSAVVGVLFSLGGDDGEGDPPPSTSAPAVNVLYEVEGTTDWASITIETPTGTHQSNPDVPLVVASGPRAGERGTLVGPFRPGDFVYISAQNKRSHGSITCRISTEDGRVIAENSSSGGYAIASCEGVAGS